MRDFSNTPTNEDLQALSDKEVCMDFAPGLVKVAWPDRTSERCEVKSAETHVWGEEELDSAERAFERQSSDQEDGQDQVRQRGGHVHGLMRYTHHKPSTQSPKPAHIMCGKNI